MKYTLDIIEQLKRMYSVVGSDLIRVKDCSFRTFVTHSNPGAPICQMKIKHIPTRDIAYIIQYNKIPDGRVIYKDGNRRNYAKNNLVVVSSSDYLKAVNIALQNLTNIVIPEQPILQPKDIVTMLALEGLKDIGFDTVARIIKTSNMGRVQKGRSMEYIRRLIKHAI